MAHDNMKYGSWSHQQLASVVGDDDDADVVGQHVHAVVARHRDGDLELARQVHVAVDGLRAARVVGAEPPAYEFYKRTVELEALAARSLLNIEASDRVPNLMAHHAYHNAFQVASVPWTAPGPCK